MLYFFKSIKEYEYMSVMYLHFMRGQSHDQNCMVIISLVLHNILLIKIPFLVSYVCNVCIYKVQQRLISASIRY